MKNKLNELKENLKIKALLEKGEKVFISYASVYGSETISTVLKVTKDKVEQMSLGYQINTKRKNADEVGHSISLLDAAEIFLTEKEENGTILCEQSAIHKTTLTHTKNTLKGVGCKVKDIHGFLSLGEVLLVQSACTMPSDMLDILFQLAIGIDFAEVGEGEPRNYTKGIKGKLINTEAINAYKSMRPKSNIASIAGVDQSGNLTKDTVIKDEKTFIVIHNHSDDKTRDVLVIGKTSVEIDAALKCLLL